MKTITVAAVQFCHVLGNKDTNFNIIEGFIVQAESQNIDIIAFPEMCITGYWHIRNLSREELLVLSETVPGGPSSQRLAEFAKKTHMIIGAGLIERTAEGALYNTYVVAAPDGSIHKHRKLHCFISEHMDSGDEYTVFDTALGWKIGVLTCYDNNIGENVRITALKGADLLIAPHQTGGCASPDPNIMGLVDKEAWENRTLDPERIEQELKGPKGRGWLMRWLPARAHDNGLFLLFSNGIGPDDDEIRTGNAMIIDPYGRILSETWKAGNDMVTAQMDPELLVNATGRRWLKTRRPDLYGPLAEKTGLEEDTRKIRFDNKGA